MRGGLQAGLCEEKHQAKGRSCAGSLEGCSRTAYPRGASSLPPHTGSAPHSLRCVGNGASQGIRLNRLCSPAAWRQAAADPLKGDTTALAVSVHPHLGTENGSRGFSGSYLLRSSFFPGQSELRGVLNTDNTGMPSPDPARTLTLALRILPCSSLCHLWQYRVWNTPEGAPSSTTEMQG